MTQLRKISRSANVGFSLSFLSSPDPLFREQIEGRDARLETGSGFCIRASKKMIFHKKYEANNLFFLHYLCTFTTSVSRSELFSIINKEESQQTMLKKSWFFSVLSIPSPLMKALCYIPTLPLFKRRTQLSQPASSPSSSSAHFKR